MEKSEVITKVTEPTKWVSSLSITENPILASCEYDLILAISFKQLTSFLPYKNLQDIIPILTGAWYF